MGDGPGVILFHGGANASQSYSKLGAALSDAFTVHIPDRRGRGLSGPFGDNYSMRREVEDVDTLLTETDAHNVFGLSSGGLIALQAALELPSVHKAVVNESPLDVDNSIITMLQSFMPRFDREIADGKVAEAIVTLLKDFGALFLPVSLQPVVNIAPRSVLVWLFGQILRRDAESVKGEDVSLCRPRSYDNSDADLGPVVDVADVVTRYPELLADTPIQRLYPFDARALNQ
jgi:pimeloyl-ACP methyl ester carboxylesterase